MSLVGNVGIVIARKWIAGLTVDDAVDESLRINRLREGVMLNYLGEDLKDRDSVGKNVNAYMDL